MRIWHTKRNRWSIAVVRTTIPRYGFRHYQMVVFKLFIFDLHLFFLSLLGNALTCTHTHAMQTHIHTQNCTLPIANKSLMKDELINIFNLYKASNKSWFEYLFFFACKTLDSQCANCETRKFYLKNKINFRSTHLLKLWDRRTEYLEGHWRLE